MAVDELGLNRLIDRCIFLRSAVNSPNFTESTVIASMYVQFVVRMQQAQARGEGGKKKRDCGLFWAWTNLHT